jgi:hypothetical protein
MERRTVSMEDFVIRIGDRNEVLILNEYNGRISIISGYEGSDGKHYFNMVFPRDGKTKEPRPTAIPQKVTLGDSMQAYKILSQFATALSKKAAYSKPNNDQIPGKPDDDDLPPF